MTAGVTDARLDTDHVFVGVTDWTHACTPERQDKVVASFALADFLDGILVEGPVSVITCIELEEVLAPVVAAVGYFQIFVGCDCHVLMAVEVRVFVPVMDDVMPTGLHHLGKLDDFLSVRAGDVFFVGDCVRQAQQMEAETHVIPFA